MNRRRPATTQAILTNMTALPSLGVRGIAATADRQLQLIVGPQAQAWASELQALLKLDSAPGTSAL